MLKLLPVLIGIVLAIYSLIDLAMSPAASVRNLPKLGWFVVILVPFAGPIAWLTAGRPTGGERPPGGQPARPSPPVAPDDDPAFLSRLEQQRQQAERERLRNWEAELKRREQDLDRSHRSDSDEDGRGDSDR